MEDTALNWFTNYLLNREQYVYLDGFSSNKSKILFGVPQGSILGPLLFLIFINDLALFCKYFFPVLFADDTNLIATHHDLFTLINLVNNELGILANWFQSNKLTLNVKKCNFMIFRHPNKYYPKDSAKILINNTELTQVTRTKFLGVVIDEGLTWFHHIDLVCNRSMKMLGILRKICPLIHPSAHLTLYYSFLYPYFNYCNLVWAATFPTFLKKPLIIPKKFLRMISHSHRLAPSEPLFRRYSILPIDKLNIYQTHLFIHKFINKKEDLPDTFHNFFTFTTDIHSHVTRHSTYNLFLPPTRTNRHQFNLSFRGPRLWSDLSLPLRSIQSQPVFKKTIKEHLVST